MAEVKNLYLVCYDIRDAKRWRKAYKILQGYGETVQYSIFRCWLSQRDREKLRWQLAQVLATEDNLLFIGVCNRCLERVQMANEPKDWSLAKELYRVL